MSLQYRLNGHFAKGSKGEKIRRIQESFRRYRLSQRPASTEHDRANRSECAIPPTRLATMETAISQKI